MADIENTLNCLLIVGKTGTGKSATGNSILARQIFSRISPRSSSNSADNGHKFGEPAIPVKFIDETLRIKVVEAPGLDDSCKDERTNIETTAKKMESAISQCKGRVDVFFWITIHSDHFSEEMKREFDSLLEVFGDRFYRHCIPIIVSSNGFRGTKQDNGSYKQSFHNWYENLKQLRGFYQDLDQRTVFFNNTDKDEQSYQKKIEHLFTLALELLHRNGPYTAEYFETAKSERQKIKQQREAQMPQEKNRRKNGFVSNDTEKVCNSPANDDKYVQAYVYDNKHDTDVNETESGVNNNLLQNVQAQHSKEKPILHEQPRRASPWIFWLYVLITIAVGLCAATVVLTTKLLLVIPVSQDNYVTASQGSLHIDLNINGGASYMSAEMLSVSAHKILYPPAGESKLTAPLFTDGNNVARIQTENDNVIEHNSGVTVANDSLYIQHPGVYYVYSSTHFKPLSDLPAGNFKHQSWFQFVHRTSKHTLQDTGVLTQTAHTVCKNCTANQETAFSGGIFYLEKDDRIQVYFSGLGLVQFDKESSFIGLVRLSN